MVKRHLVRLKSDDKYILIYGAHLVALECYRDICANGMGDRVIGFAVSDMKDNPSSLENRPVKLIGDYDVHKEDCLILIAVPYKYHQEIEITARSLGFTRIKKIRLEDISRIKGERLIEAYGHLLPYTLEKSKNDPTWLDVTGDTYQEEIRCKFPTLFYLSDEALIKESYGLMKAYEKELIGIRALTSIPKSEQITDQNDIRDIMRVYMAFDKTVAGILDNRSFAAWIIPILCGSRDRTLGFAYLCDDEWMESLSDKNSLLAEMTGAYWIWKQAKNSEYKGLCHYRRHFILTEDDIRKMKAADADVLLTTPRFVPGGIGRMFEAETPVKKEAFANLLLAMDDVAKEDKEPFEKFLENRFYFPNNMVIAKSRIYDEYCAFIFPILEKMLERDTEAKYGHKNDRHIAYASELLTSYYFIKRKDELKTYFADYKFYE